MSGFQKMIPLANGLGQLTISESGGLANVALSMHAGLGGGNVKDFAEASVSVGASIHALMLMEAGLDLLAAKFPQFSAEIKLVEAALDAEVAKL